MITSEDRQAKILDLIKKKGSVNIGDLAILLKVSDMTIRRDLSELENQGLLQRVHGGAISDFGRSYEPPLLSRSNKNIQAKKRIGKYSAGLINDGDSIALDNGSTLIELSRNLLGRENLTVITSSLHIANVLADERNIRLILSGGVVRHGERSLVGEYSHKVYQDYFVDKLFLGTGGIDLKAGLTEFNMQEALTKKEMMKSGKEVYLLADASKFDKISFASFGKIDEIHHVITDVRPDEKYIQKFEASNIKMHIITQD